MKARVLYISYDGLLEPLGQSQVLAYQERLARDFTVHLLSFEKPADWADRDARSAVAARIRAAGATWHPRRYHKRPSAAATAFDVAVGTLSGLWLVLRHRIRIVHARSYVPAVMALALKWLTGARFVFDMRGFWADERVDGELWPRAGRMYRVAKWFERRFLLNADHVISLTHAAIREIERFPYLRGRVPPFSVIPTCADLQRFRPVERAGDDEAFTLGYVGSAGTWYRFDATAAFFASLRRRVPSARLLIVNRGEHELVRRCLSNAGVPETAYELHSASHAEVPAQIARMDAGVFFIKPLFSKLASAPTKLAELLGCGVPCVANRGVGDMAELLVEERVGVPLDGFSPAELEQGVEQLLALVASPGIAERCARAAHRHFSLDGGVARYASVYRALGAAP